MSKLLDDKLIAELKGLVMDATSQAKSGHPGGAFSSMDFTTILFKEYLRFAPKNPKWFNRDRFVLSAGHESMLLYSLLCMMDLVEIEQIKNFRQLHSLTPGHPENHLTPGVEATTGPLGQGVAMAIGMAAAQKHLEATLGKDICHNKIYALCSDGDLQEPVAIGSAQLAGHWALDNLVLFYDKNDIQISGKTSRSDSTDIALMFKAMQWTVVEIDGHNHNQIREALDNSKNQIGKPLLIIGNTIIAKGTATMEGSHKTHGEPLKTDEIEATKIKLGLDPSHFFALSQDVKEYFNENLNQYNNEAAAYQNLIDIKCAADKDFAKQHSHHFKKTNNLPYYPTFEPNTMLATRAAFGKVLNYWGENLPSIIGGSADLEPSNNTADYAKTVGEFSKENYAGANIAYGVREFPMAAINNGIALYGGMIPFGATFLTFSDYCRNAIRMSAIQNLQHLYIFTHDSIFLGEDGPTHQPIEHLASLRTIPNLLVFRPADANETVETLKLALKETNRPSLFALSRQNLPVLGFPHNAAKNNVDKGAYIKYQTNIAEWTSDTSIDPNENIDVAIFATGSEVSLALQIAQILKEKKQTVRVISIPCFELFFEQDQAYQTLILSKNAKLKVSIEAGSTFGWERFVGQEGLKIGIDTFGLSASAADLATYFGFTSNQIITKIETLLKLY